MHMCTHARTLQALSEFGGQDFPLTLIVDGALGAHLCVFMREDAIVIINACGCPSTHLFCDVVACPRMCMLVFTSLGRRGGLRARMRSFRRSARAWITLTSAAASPRLCGCGGWLDAVIISRSAFVRGVNAHARASLWTRAPTLGLHLLFSPLSGSVALLLGRANAELRSEPAARPCPPRPAGKSLPRESLPAQPLESPTRRRQRASLQQACLRQVALAAQLAAPCRRPLHVFLPRVATPRAHRHYTKKKTLHPRAACRAQMKTGVRC
jgi:hypothetical protein